MQVDNVYSAEKVVAGIEVEAVEVVNGHDKVRAWEVVKDFAPNIKLNTTNLDKLVKYIADEGVDITKLKNSAKGITDEEIMQLWIDMKIPQTKLDELSVGIKNDPPANIDKWTPDHKAQRWNNYKEGTGELTFESWSNVFDGNIKKAVKGNQKVEDYAAASNISVPPAKIEEPWVDNISINLRGKPVSGKRRHDIYNPITKKASEIKDYTNQKVYKSFDIEKEALMDIKLLKDGDLNSVEWIFLGNGPSEPLRKLLKEGDIIIIIKP